MTSNKDKLVDRLTILSKLHTSTAMFKEMCKCRGIEFAYQAMIVSVDNRFGVITGSIGSNLAVCFNGEDFNSNVHPTWNIKYYKGGKTIHDYTESGEI